jgi:hypothetical protein
VTICVRALIVTEPDHRRDYHPRMAACDLPHSSRVRPGVDRFLPLGAPHGLRLRSGRRRQRFQLGDGVILVYGLRFGIGKLALRGNGVGVSYS